MNTTSDSHKFKTQLTQPQWVSLSPTIRRELAVIFGLSKSEVVRTVLDLSGHHLVSDGYSHDDLRKIDIQAMKKYLDDESLPDDFYALFEKVLNKIQNGIDSTPQEKPQAKGTASGGEQSISISEGETVSITVRAREIGDGLKTTRRGRKPRNPASVDG